MLRLSPKKRYALIPVFFGTLLITVFTILPLVHSITNLIDMYEAVLNEQLPILRLYDGRIDMEGKLPQKIILENGTYVVFDTTYNDSLFRDLPANSLFISERDIRIKIKAEILTWSLDKIRIGEKDEPLLLEPSKMREKIQKYRNLTLIIIGVAIFFIVAMSLISITFFAAGIGFMIDAFTQGAFSFGELLNLAAFILLFVIFLWIIFGSNSITTFKIFIIFYFAIMTAFVYLRVLLKRSVS